MHHCHNKHKHLVYSPRGANHALEVEATYLAPLTALACLIESICYRKIISSQKPNGAVDAPSEAQRVALTHDVETKRLVLYGQSQPASVILSSAWPKLP